MCNVLGLTPADIMQVQELQQHIKVLQAVGYNAMEGEDLLSGNNGHATDQTASDASQRSLEALLLAKNRHLEHELTMSRLKVADLIGGSSLLHGFNIAMCNAIHEQVR